jgi:hypothetical protein
MAGPEPPSTTARTATPTTRVATVRGTTVALRAFLLESGRSGWSVRPAPAGPLPVASRRSTEESWMRVLRFDHPQAALAAYPSLLASQGRGIDPGTPLVVDVRPESPAQPHFEARFAGHAGRDHADPVLERVPLGRPKADPFELLARYFDMHLYFANWGTRRLMFRLPVAAVDLDVLRAYAPGGPVTLTTAGEHAVLDLWSEVEEPEDDWFEAGQLAASLTPLRAELLRGDCRVAYLAWLLAVQDGEVDAEAQEPPVPHGLATGSAPLAALADFLRLDQDLLAAAAESDNEDRDEPGRLRAWIKRLPAQEWERWLLRAADNPDLRLGSELLGELRRAHPPVASGRRTVARLQARSEELRASRRRAAAELAAQARAAAAAARSRRLAELARRGDGAWQELEWRRRWSGYR